MTWSICLALTLVNTERGGLFTSQADDPPPFELLAGLQISAAMNGRLVEEYRAKHGMLPLSITEVGLPDTDPSLHYERLAPGGYRVVVHHGEFEAIFDSRLEAERRTALAAARSEAARVLAAEREAWAAEAETWMQEAKSRPPRQQASARDPYPSLGRDEAYVPRQTEVLR